MKLLRGFSRGLLVASCGALVLYGCGGSGSGGGSSNPVPTLEITRANAGEVATSAYESNGGLGEVAELPGTVLSAGGSNAPQIRGLAGVAWHALRTSVLAGNHPVAPAGADVPCVTGTAVESFNDTNGNNELDPGESGSITFTDCISEIGGPEIDGTMTFTLDSASETEVAFTLAFVNLTIVGGVDDENLSANGTLGFGLRSIDNPPTLVFTLSGRDLQFVEDGVALGLVGDFDFTASIGSGSSSVEFAMTVNVPSLGGVIDVATTAPLIGNPPQSGAVLVTGVDSTLTLTFMTGGVVSVVLDEGADGTPECSQDLTIGTLDQFNPAVACI